MFAFSVDPNTGDLRFNHGDFVAGDPAGEIIAACLRTPKGSAARDRSYGVDWSMLDNARDNAAAMAERAIREALAPYVRAGVFVIRSVEVQIDEPNGAVWWTVQYSDPRGASASVTNRSA